tara:strand:- start:90 stop:236 length:147 start_codon:yes stop_codon:yes gene_type:complete
LFEFDLGQSHKDQENNEAILDLIKKDRKYQPLKMFMLKNEQKLDNKII